MLSFPVPLSFKRIISINSGNLTDEPCINPNLGKKRIGNMRSEYQISPCLTIDRHDIALGVYPHNEIYHAVIGVTPDRGLGSGIQSDGAGKVVILMFCSVGGPLEALALHSGGREAFQVPYFSI
jgi:hypothetical protein